MLCLEIETTPALGSSLKTVFFGGGTPSLLAVEQLRNILEKLKGRFGIAAGAEISLEIDPGTFNKEQLQGYKDAGVNRVSLGVQAFQNQLLSVCGRSHNSNEIFTAIEMIRQVAIPEFSLDLISGLPHQTLEMWRATLEAALEISPTHISCYDLIVEPVTAFGRYYNPGAEPLPTDESTAQMYRLAHQILTGAGYEHYEISNYALPSHQCYHNRVYWENLPYYGFGMGAASYLQGIRLTRPRTRREYYPWVQQLVEAGGALGGKQISLTDILLETLMLGLRLAEGLSLSFLVKQFGEAIVEKIWTSLLPHYHQGLVEVVGATGEVIRRHKIQELPSNGRLRLSNPEGFLFSNTVLADLFSQLA